VTGVYACGQNFSILLPQRLPSASRPTQDRLVMRRVVVPITLLFVAVGCDGRTGAGSIGEPLVPVPAPVAQPVDTLLTFDAGALTLTTPGDEDDQELVIRGVPDEDLVPEERAPGIRLEADAVSGSCGGDVLACAHRGIAGCTRGEGCERARSCVGPTAACSSAADQDACARAGCTWAEHCEGEATPCSYLGDDDECSAQPGCTFSAD
jgi:hypothetical protein